MEGWQVFVEIPGKPPLELPLGESVIGRSRACAVHIPESTVSRQHAKLVILEGGQVTVADMGSSNGTFVNGDKVEGGRALANGDRVVVGEAEVVVRILPPVEPADVTMKVSIPPMTAPAPGSPAALVAAGAAAPGATAVVDATPPPPAGPAATVVQPSAPPPPAAPPPPPRRFDPPLQRDTPAPAAKPTPPPPPAAPQKGDLLPSIQEIEKMPLPPAAKKGAGVVATTAIPHAGFWLRLVAYLIDLVPILLIAAVGIALSIFVDPTLGMLVNLLQLAYGVMLVLVWPATKGWTPGKKLMKLRIYSDETRPGEGLGWSKALLRFVGYFVNSFTMGIGFLLIAFTSKKQGLHDLIAKTYVGRLPS